VVQRPDPLVPDSAHAWIVHCPTDNVSGLPAAHLPSGDEGGTAEVIHSTFDRGFVHRVELVVAERLLRGLFFSA
jgi:hypothetical protein